MKTLHRAVMTVMLTAVLAVGVGAMQPSVLTAQAQDGQAEHREELRSEGQHGHGGPQHGDAQVGVPADPAAHFAQIAERLELTADQQAELEEPFSAAIAAMLELHRLHDEIGASLSDEQSGQLAQMIHNAVSGALSSVGHGGGH